MKPTLSLSAPLATGTVDDTAAATSAVAATPMAMTEVRIGGTPGSRRANSWLRLRRPSARSRNISAVWYEHHAQRCRRRRSGGAAAHARDQYQDDHRRQIGQRRHQLRRNAQAERLGMELQDGDCAEQVRADDDAPRLPRREHHE